MCVLPGCLLHCIRGNVHRRFLVDLALLVAGAPRTESDPTHIPNTFSKRPHDYIEFNLPVDNMHDSSDPDEKSSTRMLVVIFRLNVKS